MVYAPRMEDRYRLDSHGNWVPRDPTLLVEDIVEDAPDNWLAKCNCPVVDNVFKFGTGFDCPVHPYIHAQPYCVQCSTYIETRDDAGNFSMTAHFNLIHKKRPEERARELA